MLIYTNERQLWHFANWWIGKQRWNTTQEVGASLCLSPASAGEKVDPCLPSGDSQGGGQLGFFCGLPELKVNVRGEKTAGGGGQHSQGCCSGFSRGGGGESKPGALSSLLCFLEWGSLSQ